MIEPSNAERAEWPDATRDYVAALEAELSEAKRSATLIAKDAGDRRNAARKLLCDICACAAEADPDTMELPHVVKDCIAPIETLIAERDACLFMAQQTRRYLGQDGPMVLDAIGEKAAAETRARAAEAENAALRKALQQIKDLRLSTSDSINSANLTFARQTAAEALNATQAEESSDKAALERDAARYRYLRSRDAGPDGALPPAGLFIGQVPENLILTDADADAAVDAQMARADR